MLGCWWFRWGSYGLLEFPDTFELQEGGAEVAVCGDWCLGLRQALVRRFSPLWCGPIVVCCELRVLAGVFALCWWQSFVVRSCFGGECLGKPILPARDSCYNWCLTMEFWSCVLRTLGNSHKFSRVLSPSSFGVRLQSCFSLLYFVVV